MSIKDKILGKAATEEAPSAEEAIRAHTEADAKVKELTAKQAAMRKELYELDEQLNKAALLSDTAPYKKLLAKKAELEAELDRNHRAMKVAGATRDKAADDLHAAKFEDIIKQGKRFNNSRAKAAKKMQDAIAAFNEGWREFHSDTDKLVAFGGPALGANGGFGGTLLTRLHITDAVTQELSRVSSPPPLDTSALPALPGARIITLGNPSKLQTLVEQVEQANEYILRKLSMRPSEAAKPVQPKAEQKPVEAAKPTDPDDAILSQPSGATVSAEMVQATLGRVRMS